MGISLKIHKMLWARSGNLCAICKNGLIVDSANPQDDPSVVGDEAHIIGNYGIRVQLPGRSTRRCASAASSMSSPRPGAVGRWKRPSTGRGGFEKTACMRGDGSFNSQGLVE
jgi:hypothetical protein